LLLKPWMSSKFNMITIKMGQEVAQETEPRDLYRRSRRLLETS
jgi:hypothetical protein